MVIVANSANVGAAPMFGWPLNVILSRRSLRVRRVFAQVCRRHRVRFVNFTYRFQRDAFARQREQYFAEDGLHPTSAAYGYCYTRAEAAQRADPRAGRRLRQPLRSGGRREPQVEERALIGLADVERSTGQRRDGTGNAQIQQLAILESRSGGRSLDDEIDAGVFGDHPQLHGRGLRRTADRHQQQPIEKPLCARALRVQPQVAGLWRVQPDVVQFQ